MQHDLPKAILFDMDGTLTKPMLDFPAIKRGLGIGDRPILEAIAEMNDAEKAVANEILHRHEERAAVESALNTGCLDLLRWIDSRNIRTAIITRNSRRCAEIVITRHSLSFDVVITREDGKFKPDPTPLLLACQRLQIPAPQTWMVGDGQYDVEAGIAANIKTIWVSHGKQRFFGAQPWLTVQNLEELAGILNNGKSTAC